MKTMQCRIKLFMVLASALMLGCYGDASPEVDAAVDEEPDRGSVLVECSTMDRSRHQDGGAATPVYLDPMAPATPASATFQTIAGQPASALNAQHLNLMTEEMWKLVRALGLAPASDDDTQLATLFDQSDRVASGYTHGDPPAPQGFVPVLTPTPTNVTYTIQQGMYCRVGHWVWMTVDLEWQNDEDTENANAASILLPYEGVQINTGPPIVGPAIFYGIVAMAPTTFGAQNAVGVPQAIVNVSTLPDRVGFALSSTVGAIPTEIALGDSEVRRVLATIAYTTNGTYQY